MNTKTLIRIAVSVAAAAPLMAFAADLTSILGVIETLLNLIIPILLILATVVFLYGVITYLTAGGDEEKAATGRAYIIWGLIALAAMIAIWGLVLALISTFGVGGQTIPVTVGGL